MNRKLRTKLPSVPENLVPKEIDKEKMLKKEQAYRERYTNNYNARHRVVTLPALQEGDQVFIRDQEKYGEVKEKLANPRSYKVLTESGTTIRRNRRALVHTEERMTQTDTDSAQASPTLDKPSQPIAPNTESPKPDPPQIVRRSGRLAKPLKQPEMIYY